MSPRSTLGSVSSKAFLVPPLLLALYLLTDDDTSYSHSYDGDGNGNGNSDSDSAFPTPTSDSFDSTTDLGHTFDHDTHHHHHHRHHHLALVTALERHPPCMRVFRALSELVLLLFCVAFALWVWERPSNGVRRSDVGTLLFGPVSGDADGGGIDAHVEKTDGQEREREYEYEYEIEFEDGGSDLEGSAYDLGFDKTKEDDGDDDDDESMGIDALERRLNSIRGNGGNNDDVPPLSRNAASALPPNADGRGYDYAPNEPSIPEQSAWPRPQTEPAPPSAASVASAALDLLLLLLVCLFFFTLSSAEGGRYIDDLEDATFAAPVLRSVANVAAPVFPLVLFFAASAMAFLPWNGTRRRGSSSSRRRRNGRRSFWTVVGNTVMAPYREVTFRDGLVGDVLTSAVRPMQDLAFTSFYLVSGLNGWWSSSYGIDDAATPVERSWLLHTVVLPGCMASPLWWRFLQNLRQCHDTRKRWPHLGNAFKYFIAAEVALFGVFDPGARQHVAWILCFAAATLYQVWWDVFMDWELLVRRTDGDARTWWLWTYRLRSKRLYASTWTYYSIFVVNLLLRFCWTLSFVPRSYLSRSGLVVNSALGDDFQAFVEPALASAEIVRRTLWALLRVELEAIKVFGGEGGRGTRAAAAAVTAAAAATAMEAGSYDLRCRAERNEEMTWAEEEDDDDEGLKPMAIGTLHGPRFGTVHALGPLLDSSGVMILQSDMSTLTDLQIMGELCLWGTAFTSLGILAAAHRQVM